MGQNRTADRKRILALLLCGMLIFTDSGCAASQSAGEDAGQEESTVTQTLADAVEDGLSRGGDDPGTQVSLPDVTQSGEAQPDPAETAETEDRAGELVDPAGESENSAVEPESPAAGADPTESDPGTAEGAWEIPEGSLKYSLTTVTEPRDGWVIAFDTLNVRRFCYSHGTIIGTFSSGQRITVNGPARYGFYPVTGIDAGTGEEITGYCSANYISLMEYTGNAVSLDVVSFTQTDSRWSELQLGESRFTLGQVGCTTTCFAMSESYLTGQEITPEEMSRMLVYSLEANLFWPDQYTQNYTTEYLSEIYMKLHQGIPVLIGSRRRSGSQHWVLVIGYDPGGRSVTGSSDLKASDFIINDPSGTRSNLGQFFRDLPNYIKIAYYSGS